MNEGYEYAEQVGLQAAGQSVLTYLARRYRHSKEAVWRARVAAGEILINGVRATAVDVLRPGQRLVWRRPPWEEPPVPLAFALLYRDEHLLAVAKPRGLPTIPNGGFLTHTLLHLVRRHFPEATPMHRLGRGTSGLLLFARTPAARATVAAAWRDRRVHLAFAGHPLVGDPVYVRGGVPSSEPGLPGDPGYRLHAHRLVLDHPVTGARLEMECAPPADLQAPG